MIFDVPTKKEGKIFLDAYPFDESIISLDNFSYTIHPEGSIETLYAGNQIQTWQVHLANRMYQTRWSWVMLNHLFSKGIPDEEWYISPGKNGSSIEYFPHFDENHHLIKAQFDYFSDIFYYKLFSALDTLGHILNEMYGLDVRKVDFHKAVEALKDVRPTLYSNLNNLKESEEFKKMKEFRHSSTHNELVGNISSGMAKFSGAGVSGITFGVGDYIPSSQVKDNADKSLTLLTQAIEFIREQIQNDTT